MNNVINGTRNWYKVSHSFRYLSTQKKLQRPKKLLRVNMVFLN